MAASILTERGLSLEKVRAEIRDVLRTRAEATGGDHANEEFLSARARTPMVLRPHIVLVQLTVRTELLEQFRAAVLHNARESLANDPGCLRFDVSQHADDPARWILHEVYANAEAHAAHRRSPHFLAYDEVAREAVIDKSVVKAVGRHLT